MIDLSDQIRQARHGAAGNPFQGKDKRVLFVCSMGILRSATAARLYARKYNTRAAGTYEEALVKVSPLLVEWADEVVFVNRDNHDNIRNEAPYKALLDERTVKVLDIPDYHEHMSPELIQAFSEQYEKVT